MFSAARGLEAVVTDPGVEEGGTGTAVTTGGGATGAMTGERETAATPGTTGALTVCLKIMADDFPFSRRRRHSSDRSDD